VAGGVRFSTPEIPTTWPTLDEVYGRVGSRRDELVNFYKQQIRPGLNVHTVHAELEGMTHRGYFEALLDVLHPEVEFLRLTDVASELEPDALAEARIVQGEVPGRAGTVTLQAEFA